MRTATENDVLEQGLDPSPWRWVETAVLTLGPVLLAWVIRPHDPLFVISGFPWLAFAPLMAGLRYGFAHGFASALALAFLMGAGHRLGLGGPEAAEAFEALPGARIVGTLVVGMLAGEFSDRWVRRIQRLRVVGRYRQQRLEEFSRAYHLLKVSHDRLEERMAGSTTSLRGALLALRTRLSDGQVRGLVDVGDAIMDLFAEHGWVQVAGLHEVDDRGRVVPEPVGRLGAVGRIDPDQPLVRRAVETRSLVTVRELPEASGALAVVPLSNVDRTLVGVVVIHEMPFVAFTEEHLYLLVVLGGHTADILLAAEQALGASDPAAQDFLRSLRRAYEDYRLYDLPSSLAAVSFGPPAVRMGVDRVVEGTKRGLDQEWRRVGPDGRIVLFLVMPLTDAQGVDGYQKRIQVLVKERFAGAFAQEEVQVVSRPVVKDKAPELQLQEFGRQCGFGD